MYISSHSLLFIDLWLKAFQDWLVRAVWDWTPVGYFKQLFLKQIVDTIIIHHMHIHVHALYTSLLRNGVGLGHYGGKLVHPQNWRDNK